MKYEAYRLAKADPRHAKLIAESKRLPDIAEKIGAMIRGNTGQRIIPGTCLYHYKARAYLFTYFSWDTEYAIAAKPNPN